MIWRRWRHLLVCAVAMFVVTLAGTVAGDMLQRPRPLGVEILGPWQGSAMPSVPMAFLTAILVTGLYTLVPAGRLRERGKLVVAGLLAVTALSRLYLAQEGPFDVLFAVVSGWLSRSPRSGCSPRTRRSRSATAAAAPRTSTSAAPGTTRSRTRWRNSSA